MKHNIITTYLNPVDKVWESEKESKYLSETFTTWDDYAKIKRSSDKGS